MSNRLATLCSTVLGGRRSPQVGLTTSVSSRLQGSTSHASGALTRAVASAPTVTRITITVTLSKSHTHIQAYWGAVGTEFPGLG